MPLVTPIPTPMFCPTVKLHLSTWTKNATHWSNVTKYQCLAPPPCDQTVAVCNWCQGRPETISHANHLLEPRGIVTHPASASTCTGCCCRGATRPFAYTSTKIFLHPKPLHVFQREIAPISFWTNINIIKESKIDLSVLNSVVEHNLLHTKIPHVRHSCHHVKEHIWDVFHENIVRTHLDLPHGNGHHQVHAREPQWNNPHWICCKIGSSDMYKIKRWKTSTQMLIHVKACPLMSPLQNDTLR